MAQRPWALFRRFWSAARGLLVQNAHRDQPLAGNMALCFQSFFSRVDHARDVRSLLQQVFVRESRKRSVFELHFVHETCSIVRLTGAMPITGSKNFVAKYASLDEDGVRVKATPLLYPCDEPSLDRVGQEVRQSFDEGVVVENGLCREPTRPQRATALMKCVEGFGDVAFEIPNEVGEVVVRCSRDEMVVVRHEHHPEKLDIVTLNGACEPRTEDFVHVGAWFEPEPLLDGAIGDEVDCVGHVPA